MALVIIIFGALYAFIAWAPEQLTQAMLALAWGLAILMIVGQLIYGFGSMLF